MFDLRWQAIGQRQALDGADAKPFIAQQNVAGPQDDDAHARPAAASSLRRPDAAPRRRSLADGRIRPP
jgi:hypothetical protein